MRLRSFARLDERYPIRHVAYSPDGKTVTSDWRVWEAATGRVLANFENPDGSADFNPNFFRSFYSPDSSRILTADVNGVRLWDAATGKQRRWAIRANLNFNFSAVSPDGRLLATGGIVPVGMGPSAKPDPPIRIWELASGKEVAKLIGHKEMTCDLKFSGDGRFLASGSGGDSTDVDRSVRIWDIATSRELRCFEGHLAPVIAIAFSPDGKSVVSGSGDATALVWDISDLRETPKAPRLTAEGLAARWAELASNDATVAYRARWALSTAQSVDFLSTHLEPIPSIEPDRIATLIRDLDSDRASTRATASEELARLGDRAGPALRKALANQPSDVSRAVIERLLTALKEPLASADVLRRLRAIAALEYAGSAEALGALERLSRGDPAALETAETRLSRDRLSRRLAKP
jgi:WD40 repeat protein